MNFKLIFYTCKDSQGIFLQREHTDIDTKLRYFSKRKVYPWIYRNMSELHLQDCAYSI